PALYHILKDHLGSARAVIDVQGAVVASYQYLPFGALAGAQEPYAGFLPYLYTGQEYDAEIGLYNYRARFYHAAIGRFIATDPGRQFFSPYIYASNNPVLFIDPTGMFSIGSFFSAIGGIIIGAVEILVGVVIDVVAAVLDVVTGGLGTPATIALGAFSGIFYGAGVSAITYSAFHFDDFSWKDYGIQMGIGAATGLFSGGFGAGLGIAAKSAQAALTEFAASARAGAAFLEYFGRPGVATAFKAGAWVSEKGAALAGLATNGPVAAGWGALAKGIGVGVIKSEAIGISINTGKNLALGRDWDTNLGQVLFSSALSGSIGGLQISNRIKFAGA
ncbi:MAG: RHS repeat-associated core domain-containing protein, partial [Chitinophagaceae bacterium]